MARLGIIIFLLAVCGVQCTAITYTYLSEVREKSYFIDCVRHSLDTTSEEVEKQIQILIMLEGNHVLQVQAAEWMTHGIVMQCMQRATQEEI